MIIKLAGAMIMSVMIMFIGLQMASQLPMELKPIITTMTMMGGMLPIIIALKEMIVFDFMPKDSNERSKKIKRTTLSNSEKTKIINDYITAKK